MYSLYLLSSISIFVHPKFGNPVIFRRAGKESKGTCVCAVSTILMRIERCQKGGKKSGQKESGGAASRIARLLSQGGATEKLKSRKGGRRGIKENKRGYPPSLALPHRGGP